ncbi:hypothetical protein G6011_01915 [Alternaria panax]|uniref:Uncharacterized protein n=1 Tax=Alternaria panax TaxID=48097 RepID=A0AAD4I716_9PLEO|nr:hypothetical protein G6011_01915 [Alternaria panax]
MQQKVFGKVPNLFDITPLLRAIWRLKRMPDVSFTQQYGPSEKSHYEVLRCNSSAMSAVMRHICQGQLQLRQYEKLPGAIGLNRDGSGGMISWPTTNYDWRGTSREVRPKLVAVLPDPDCMSDFVTTDDGSRLKLMKPNNRASLLGLPYRILGRILGMVLSPVEGTHIDLNKDTKFNCGFIHVN